MKKQSFQEVEFNNPLKNKINDNEIKLLSKKMRLVIISPMIIVLIGILTLMPIFSVRSLASNILDSIGNHKAALVVDALNSKGLANSWDLLTSNLDKDECTIPRSNTLTPDYDTLGFSAKSYVNVYPKKNGLNSSIALSSYFEGSNNLSENSSYTYNETNLKIDLEKIELGPNFNINLKSEIFNKSDEALYINPIEFQYETANGSDKYTKKVNEWYKFDLGLTEEQKNAVRENNRILNNYSLIPPESLFNEKTIKEISNAVCENIDDVNVYSYSEFSFGPGNEKYKLRPIEIVISDKIFENLPKNIQNIADSMASDDVLKQNLKNSYDDISKFIKNQGILNNVDSSDVLKSKEEFDQEIDKSFDNLKKSLEEDPIQPNAFDFVTDSTKINQELIVYLEEGKLDTSAIYSEITLVPRDLNSIPEPFRDELSEGLVISTLIFDIRTNINAVKKDLPQETKSIESLGEDLGLNKLVEQIKNFNIPSFFDKNESQLDETNNPYLDDFNSYNDPYLEGYNDLDLERYENSFIEKNPGFILSGGEDTETDLVKID